MNRARIIVEVFSDMREAVDWYDLRDDELGDRLENEFYAALSKIAAHPLMHQSVYKEFRRVLLKPFPYLLYYRLDGGTVVVVLLFHAARNPHRARNLLDHRRFL
jgi:plasmid stabilization system protein ParE